MKLKILSLLILILLISALTVASAKITSIKVKNSNSCINENTPDVANLKNKNIIFLNTQKAQAQIQKETSCIQGLEIKKVFPSTLEISAQNQIPIAKIAGSDLAITETGLVIRGEVPPPAPNIFIPENIKVEERKTIADSNVLQALKITKEIEKSDFIPANVRILEGDDVAVYSSQEAVALFAPNKDAAEQVDSLQSILAKAKIDAAKIAKIDLRFRQPVLNYKNN